MSACRCVLLVIAFLVSGSESGAADPFRYPEGRHGKGQLRYINDVPVLTVAGSPKEIGEQVGILAVKPAAELLGQAKKYITELGWGRVYPVMLKMASTFAPQIPPDHLAEIEAAAVASGLPRDLLLFTNVAPDLRVLAGCSALIVEKTRTGGRGLLVGRNVDWQPVGRLPEYCLVTVYRPAGKQAFAAVGYPGIAGVLTGMNDAGVVVADLTVNSAKDGSVTLDPSGVPYALAMRRVMEESQTVDEAEKLLRSLRRTVRQNLVVSDLERGVVFEITPKTLIVRGADGGVCACTNHFRSPELAVETADKRYATLLAKIGDGDVFGVADVARRMGAVNQEEWTIQTMVFEPAASKLHIASGYGPATRLPLCSLELKPLFQRGASGK